MDGRDRATPAEAGSGGSDEGMGKGVQQRGSGDRPGGTYAGERPEALPAEKMDRGADLLVALSEQEDELRDYERLPETGEAFIYVAMSRLMARRLARS
jgi:hypothetical protein